MMDRAAATAPDRTHGPQPPSASQWIAYAAPLYEYAVLADRKASSFMSAGGLMLTVLGFMLNRVVHVLSAGNWLAWIFGAALCAVIILVIVSGVTSYIAFARLLPPTPPSLAVFRDIAKRTAEEYTADIRSLSHLEAFTAMLHYNHVVATWAAGKFRLVNRALSLLRVAIVLWMVVLLVLAIAG